MTCNFTCIFRFEGEIAVPSGLFKEPWPIYLQEGMPSQNWPPFGPDPNDPNKVFHMWRDKNGDGDYQADEWTKTGMQNRRAVWPDSKGNLWMGGGNIIRWNMQGFDNAGNPIYSEDKITDFGSAPGFGGVQKLDYNVERDILVVADNGSIGVFKDWSKGNRTPLSRFDARSTSPCGYALAGDYIFDVGCCCHPSMNDQSGDSRTRVSVHRLENGEFIGFLEPANAAGGYQYTMVDICYPITAFQRSTNEYIVLVEDDAQAKVLMYRWAPDPLVPEIPLAVKQLLRRTHGNLANVRPATGRRSESIVRISDFAGRSIGTRMSSGIFLATLQGRTAISIQRVCVMPE
jgi:hypothetical protein